MSATRTHFNGNGTRVEVPASTSIGQNVYISPDGAKIGEDVVIHDGVRIGDQASIGRAAILCSGACVRSDSTVGEGAVVSRNASVGFGARLGDGALILDGVHLPDNATILPNVAMQAGRVGQYYWSAYWNDGDLTLRFGCCTHPVTAWPHRKNAQKHEKERAKHFENITRKLAAFVRAAYAQELAK